MKRLVLLLFLLALPVPSPAHAAEFEIIEAHQQFSENAVSINPGDTVVFRNADNVTHNILIENAAGAVNDTGLQKPGGVIRETLSAPGDYKAHCGLHPKMVLKISVLAARRVLR